MIAMALSCDPQLLIADEPTTALDVTIQAQILELLRRIRRDFGMALLLITHDMGVVAGIVDRVNVMYAGRIAEHGLVDTVFANPRHPYTMGLMASVPRLDQPRTPRLITIEGSPPDLLSAPHGCPFAARCSFSIAQCVAEMPLLATVSGNSAHRIACCVDVTAGTQDAGMPTVIDSAEAFTSGETA